MRRKKISITKAAAVLDIRRETLHHKIYKKRPFLLKEALAIHEMYFPEWDFKELFEDYK